MQNTAEQEAAAGERFDFGKNWQNFLESLTDEKVKTAEESVKELLGLDTLVGKKFIDVGCGSGLFSLAARRLGADVVSFDYDSNSVAATRSLRNRFFPECENWRIEEGSVLDLDYLKSLGQFDVVYSWGVLHHTGAMWTAFDNVTHLIAPDGLLAIAIYNDQGWKSTAWTQLKKIYCKAPNGLKQLYLYSMISALEVKGFAYAIARNQVPKFINRRLDYARQTKRGMNHFHDMIDWIGGYPFEVASTTAVVDYFAQFQLTSLLVNSDGPHNQGCNEFVFKKSGV